MRIPPTTARPLPALSEHTRLRYATFILLYLAQGLPEGVVLFAIPAWLAMQGKTAAEIAAYSAVVLLPASFKIVFAPLVERFTYLPMGRRRPWLLAGQVGLTFSFAGLALVPDPLHHLPWLTAGGFAVLAFSVLQDVATDSLAIDIIPAEQQGQANSLMWGAKTVGMAGALAGGSLLINTYGFGTAILTITGVVLLILPAPVLLRERPGEKLLPWTAGAPAPESARLHTHGWAPLLRAARRVLVLPNSLLVAAIVFTGLLCLSYVRTALPLFTIQQLHWTNVAYAQVQATAGLVGGVGGMLAGGALIRWCGLTRLGQGCFLVIGLLAGALGGAAAYWGQAGVVAGFIGGFSLLATLFQISNLALAMQCCWQRVSAVQFTLYMALANAGMTTGIALLGYVRTHYPWNVTFWLVPALVLVPVVLLQTIRPTTHARQVAALEDGWQEQAAGAQLVAG